MKRAGLGTIWAYDLWPEAIAVHEANLKPFLFKLNGVKRAHRRNLGGFDIEALKKIKKPGDLAKLIQEVEALGDILRLIPEIVDLAPDMIVGGPPCQPWSRAGSKLSDKDPRAKLTDAFGIIVCSARPRYFVMENVPEIQRSRIFARVKSMFKRAGYGLTEQVLEASYYGVPQARSRLFLIGCLGETNDWLVDHLEAAKSPSQTTVADVLGIDFGKLHHLRKVSGGRKVWQGAGKKEVSSLTGRESEDTSHTSTAVKNETAARFFWLAPVWPKHDVGSRRTDQPIKTISHGILAGPTDAYPVKPGKDVEDIWTLPIPTFQQMAMLGGFPEKWDWSAVRSKQDRMQILANAVPPPMAEAIGRCIVAHHKGERAPTEVKVPPKFKTWLKKEKRFKESRRSQVLSEFKAVQQLIGSRHLDDLQTGLGIMDRIPKFQALSAARKSNLRKALRLYAECHDYYEERSRPPFQVPTFRSLRKRQYNPQVVEG